MPLLFGNSSDLRWRKGQKREREKLEDLRGGVSFGPPERRRYPLTPEDTSTGEKIGRETSEREEGGGRRSLIPV